MALPYGNIRGAASVRISREYDSSWCIGLRGGHLALGQRDGEAVADQPVKPARGRTPPARATLTANS